MKVVAYYTPGPYEFLAAELEANLTQFGLSYVIQEVSDRGSWLKNTAQKPVFLRSVIDEVNEPILYMDVDARVHIPLSTRFFDLLNFVDIAPGYFEKTGEVLSSTIFINNTEKARELLDFWIQCQTDIDFDQRVLEKVLDEIPDLKYVYLPPKYCHIFDSGENVGTPVIVQYQASRKYRDDYGLENPR